MLPISEKSLSRFFNAEKGIRIHHLRQIQRVIQKKHNSTVIFHDNLKSMAAKDCHWAASHKVVH